MNYSKQLVRVTLVQIETVSFAASVTDLFSKDPSVHALRNNLCPYSMSCCSSPRVKQTHDFALWLISMDSYTGS